MKARTVEADVRHARLVAGAMRAKDVAEIRAGWNREPYEAIREALSASYYARTLLVGFEPLCMYGLAPLTVLGGAARVWMFATAAIDRHPFTFARESKRALTELYLRCQLATNLVDLSDEPVLKWLQWLGGTYALPLHERGGRLFAQFILVNRRVTEARACQQA